MEIPRIELSAASAFEGRDVPSFLFTQVAAPEHWEPHLQARTLWVAEMDGQLVGFLAATAQDERLHVDEVDVVRTHQGRGIGRRLIAAAVSEARRRGLGSLSLTTFRNVPWNAPFYASLGFEEWARKDAPQSIRAALRSEAARGLTNRCAMRLTL